MDVHEFLAEFVPGNIKAQQRLEMAASKTRSVTDRDRFTGTLVVLKRGKRDLKQLDFHT